MTSPLVTTARRVRPEPLVRQPHPRARARRRSRRDSLRDGIRGVTSNPTIFDKAMGSGNGTTSRCSSARVKDSSIEDTYWALVVDDITHATDVCVRCTTRRNGGDGLVSVEVSPELAHDTEQTVPTPVDLHSRVDRPNVMIKIPATLEGLPAITRTIAAGINVNVTLIFSLDRHDAVIDAYLDGLEQLDADRRRRRARSRRLRRSS